MHMNNPASQRAAVLASALATANEKGNTTNLAYHRTTHAWHTRCL